MHNEILPASLPTDPPPPADRPPSDIPPATDLRANDEPDPLDWRSAVAEVDLSFALRPPGAEAAEILLELGHLQPACALYREWLERDPVNLAALRGLVAVLERAERTDEAALVRQRIFEVEANELGVPDEAHEDTMAFFAAADGLESAEMTEASTPPGAPVEYITALFDRYAPRFEKSLVERLGYCGPEVLTAAIRSVLGDDVRGLRVLDAGCGTGLAGPHLRPLAAVLDGVDLSPRMIARAQQRGLHDRLIIGELVETLREHRDAYDLIVAADVLIYFGDLAPVFEAAAGALKSGGMFGLTVEVHEADLPSFVLQPTRRFAHAERYVRDLAGRSGFAVAHHERTTLRTEQARPVMSHVFVLCAR